MKQAITTTKKENICKCCEEVYDPKVVKRVYGDLAPGYCSAGCYTEDFMKLVDAEPAPKPSPIGKEVEGFTGGELFLSIGLQTDDEKVQLINHEGEHIANIEFYPLKETANTIINSVNNYPTLYRENKEIKEYIEYVDGKVEINEFPLSFDQWKELI